MILGPPRAHLFPYTTLFRSLPRNGHADRTVDTREEGEGRERERERERERGRRRKGRGGDLSGRRGAGQAAATGGCPVKFEARTDR